jgi:hypothetical protein
MIAMQIAGRKDVKLSRWGAALMCVLASFNFFYRQSASKSLLGVVKDPAGAVLPGATITLSD